MFPVYVDMDGGELGSDSTTCDATYHVYDLGGNELPDGDLDESYNKTPEWNVRLANVIYSIPGIGSEGSGSTSGSGSGTIGTPICMACYDNASPPNLHLLVVPESPESGC